MAPNADIVNRPRAGRVMLVAALLVLASCTNPIDQRGNLPKPDKLVQIKPGSTDKATVTRLLGSPSSVAAFDANTWYYISQKTQPFAFFTPSRLDQEVVAIDFNNKGIVSDVRRKTMADAEAVKPDPNATPASGRTFTLLEQLIGNLGRFSGQPTTNGRPGGP
ncbi:MAG TPA: outer membrane protein assembly factor BamE [Stellaceae bacterium]|nr:outer membrane protein assembly factor BamE [Stellaceae bacterium]